MSQRGAGQTPVTSAHVVLPFTPAFYVQTSEVVLSNEMMQSKLRVSGTSVVLKNLKVRALCIHHVTACLTNNVHWSKM